MPGFSVTGIPAIGGYRPPAVEERIEVRKVQLEGGPGIERDQARHDDADVEEMAETVLGTDITAEVVFERVLIGKNPRERQEDARSCPTADLRASARTAPTSPAPALAGRPGRAHRAPG